MWHCSGLHIKQSCTREHQPMLLIIDSSLLTAGGTPEWAMISSNSCVWPPSLLPSFRKVRGRPQNLLPWPINSNSALTTLGPSWSRSDCDESTGATGKASLYGIVCHLWFVQSQSYSNSSWSEASDRHYSQTGPSLLWCLNSSFIICFSSSFWLMGGTRCHGMLS